MSFDGIIEDYYPVPAEVSIECAVWAEEHLKAVAEYSEAHGVTRKAAAKHLGHKGFSRPSAARLKVKR